MHRVILFVYGTLKRGQRNHRLLADQLYRGDAASAPRYRIVDLGAYPGLVENAEHGLSVTGELWEVSDCCLAELDDFEGVPDLFDRRVIDVPDLIQPVQGYFWVREVPPGAPSSDRWPVR